MVEPTPATVEIWPLDLRLPNTGASALVQILSADERERASRFVFNQHRTRYIVAHALLRMILASYRNEPPQNLIFSYGAAGKPMLGGWAADSDVLLPHFNLSHSEDLALVAVCGTAPVGVDVERIKVMPDVSDLVRRFFSPTEAARFSALPFDVQPAAFFNLWTRKEAILKATGEGIGHSLNCVEVTFIPSDAAVIHNMPPAFGRVQDWTLRELRVRCGFAGAVAVRDSKAEVRYRSPEALLARRETQHGDAAT